MGEGRGMRRYAWLLAMGLLASAGGLLGTRFLRAPAPAAEVVAPMPTTELLLVLEPAGLSTSAAAVPLGHRVTLRVRNERQAPVTLVLQGYEDRFRAGPIEPDATWRGEFVADRPGEAFAWLVEGEVVGRLQVIGSHLVEGHR